MKTDFVQLTLFEPFLFYSIYRLNVDLSRVFIFLSYIFVSIHSYLNLNDTIKTGH